MLSAGSWTIGWYSDMVLFGVFQDLAGIGVWRGRGAIWAGWSMVRTLAGTAVRWAGAGLREWRRR